MLDSGLLIGAPRLRVLDTDKTTVLKTLYLPFADKDGGVVLNDVHAKAIKKTLLNGVVRYIQGGVRHNVTLTYGLYDPLFASKQLGKSIGNANNQVPELTQLLDILSEYNNGRLAVSPCSNQEIWYRSVVTSEMPRNAIYPAAFGNFSIAFEGIEVFAKSSSTTPIAS